MTQTFIKYIFEYIYLFPVFLMDLLLHAQLHIAILHNFVINSCNSLQSHLTVTVILSHFFVDSTVFKVSLIIVLLNRSRMFLCRSSKFILLTKI